jgi:hypothetical protein
MNTKLRFPAFAGMGAEGVLQLPRLKTIHFRKGENGPASPSGQKRFFRKPGKGML